jgi:transcriptional regulator with PAS, ATPase and Fis domain
MLAESILSLSGRRNMPFIKMSCGALPETLLESELFGHKTGAYEGAIDNKPGRLRLAHNGTLYITEISDLPLSLQVKLLAFLNLPLSLQVKLLAFLNEGTVYPMGSSQGIQVDVRIIAATHRDLDQMAVEGLFRRDLLFRLNAVRLHLPTLQEREQDTDLLLDHFVKIFSIPMNKKIEGFSRDARHLLLNYDYPGNIRELRNIVEYAVRICRSHQIGVEHLPAYLVERTETRDAGARPTGEGESRQKRSGFDWNSIERQLIIDTLIKVNGHRSKAAEILGWARSTLWRKMKQHGIDLSLTSRNPR